LYLSFISVEKSTLMPSSNPWVVINCELSVTLKIFSDFWWSVWVIQWSNWFDASWVTQLLNIDRYVLKLILKFSWNILKIWFWVLKWINNARLKPEKYRVFFSFIFACIWRHRGRTIGKSRHWSFSGWWFASMRHLPTRLPATRPWNPQLSCHEWWREEIVDGTPSWFCGVGPVTPDLVRHGRTTFRWPSAGHPT